MDDESWLPGDGATDPDVEWAFFGVHDIEYWVVRDGRLVPADATELERIAERERERAAQARLPHWERAQRQERRSGVIARFVSRCRGWLRQSSARVRLPEPELDAGQGESTPRRRSDVAHRRT